MRPPLTASLSEHKAYLRQHWEQGVDCSCCGQKVKLYPRTINSAMAASLVVLYREKGLEFGHVPSLSSKIAGYRGGEESKLRYWRLLEEERAIRDDGGRTGWWRVTPLGEQFVLGKVLVPKRAMVYNGQCFGLDGPAVSIQDCLHNKFSLRVLLSS